MNKLRDYLELTKPRITLFVVLTGFVGFAAGLPGPLAQAKLPLLVHTLLGIAFVASGTSAFNQLCEIGLDSRMARTRNRPLPAGRLRPLQAGVFATTLAVAGLAELWIYTNPITTALAAATLLSYVFAYTPLKTRSPIALLVGAVPGALPPLGGFTAAHGSIAPLGLALFLLLFLWQLPHFLAIGWRHRRDYHEAGFRILPALDGDGTRTGHQALLYCVALLPAALAPALLGATGPVYAVGALLLTLVFLAAAHRFSRETTDAAALRLFLVSIAWLPAVLVLFVADRVW